MAQIWGDTSLKKRKGQWAFEEGRDLMGRAFSKGEHYSLIVLCGKVCPCHPEFTVIQKVLTDLYNG